MEKTNVLDNFKTSLIFLGKVIYRLEVVFGYYEEEALDGFTSESMDFEIIYRLIEQYLGDDENNKPCYSYHILTTTVGGTFGDESIDTMESYEKYETKEEALNFIHDIEKKYEKRTDAVLFIEK